MATLDDTTGPTETDQSRLDAGRRRGVGRPPLAFFVALILLAGVAGWWIGKPSNDSFNDVDVGFLADMTVHHQGAISLGFNYLPREHDTLVAHFAREIIFLQSQQVGRMNGLLDEAGNPESTTDDVVKEWMGEPMNVRRMPGLATEGEFAELRAAEGVAADDVFTRLMIRHHAGGATMAEYAAEHGSNRKVRDLAASMARVQRLEIGEMNSARSQLGLPPVDVSDVEKAMRH